jgi:putative flippase GtrA
VGRLLGHTPVRFVLSGSAVATCQFTTMPLLVAAGVSDQLAVAGAYFSALVLHFTLNREFVFATDSGYALHLTAQGVRYVSIAFTSYVVTSTAVALLPGPLDATPLAVFYGASLVAAALSFVVLRRWVFGPGASRA